MVHSISFQTFWYRNLYRLLKIQYVICYTSYEMTDQFLGFQIQMKSYRRNWNTPY